MPSRLIFFLYRTIQIFAFPALLCYLSWRVLRNRRYAKGLWERFGRLPRHYGQTAGDCVWFHAVSVGEVLAAQSLLEELRRRQPELGIYLSVGTVAGRELADKRLRQFTDGIFYAPLDYCFAVRAVLRLLRPLLLVVLETEIWPNMWREARHFGSSLLVVNGRISDKAFSRYRRWRWLLAPALRLPNEILVQDSIAAHRYRELGAPAGRVREAGNLKYDFRADRAVTAATIESFLDRLRPESVWIAASTMPPAWSGDVDEDLAVLDAFEQLAAHRPGLLLIHVPRKPERFDWVADEIARRGLRFVRRSRLADAESLELPGILLLDTIGELAGVFRLGDAVFLGGTLADRGGHNVLEPAFFGRPIVLGPNMQNFAEIAQDFRSCSAVVEISGPGELSTSLARLLDDPGLRAELGRRALAAAARRSGATQAALNAVEQWMDESLVTTVRPFVVRLLFWPLTRLWKLGVAARRWRQQASAQRLRTPVVSVGGLSMGGVGKTPFVAMLTRVLSQHGLRPAVLTRGYKRRKADSFTILRPGETADVAVTGDEAQTLLKMGTAAIGIGGNRFEVGRKLEEQVAPDVVVLDDGFQHWRLTRQLDLVLIDTLDPLAGGLFPLGRLREGPESLARAGGVILTRCRPGRRYRALREWVHHYHPGVPCYCARIEIEGLLDGRTGAKLQLKDLPAGKGVAFCGLGNPVAFWRSLRQAALPVAARRSFADHHRYDVHDLDELERLAAAHQAKYLITTEKDCVNLPSNWSKRIPHLPVYILRVRMTLDDPAALLDRVRASLALL